MAAVIHNPSVDRVWVGMLITATIIGIWLAVFTRGALTTLDRFGRSRSMRMLTCGFPQLRLNPENKLVFWFYRIDGAVVAIGCIYGLIAGQHFR